MYTHYNFTIPLINVFTIFYNMAFYIVVRQEVKSFDITVVVHRLKLAKTRDLYGILIS